jgi:hypothetical protein
MTLVRVVRKDGTKYLAEVMENPATTHDHPHKHWMIVKGKGMIQFEHKHRHVHAKGSLKFHAHKHTPEQLKGIFRGSKMNERRYPYKDLREDVAKVGAASGCPACKEGRPHRAGEDFRYHAMPVGMAWVGS